MAIIYLLREVKHMENKQYKEGRLAFKSVDPVTEKVSTVNVSGLNVEANIIEIKEYILEKKEAIIQKNDRRVEQINLFVRICPDV